MHPSRTPMHPYMTPMRDSGGKISIHVKYLEKLTNGNIQE